MKEMKIITMLIMLLIGCGTERVMGTEKAMGTEMNVEESFEDNFTEEIAVTEENIEESIKEPKYSLMVENGTCDIGNMCVLGTYQMDEQSGVENIEWMIVKEEDGKLLLISKYLLPELHAFHDVINNYTTTYWDTCTLRQWLNNDFYNVAFNSEEKNIILYSEVNGYDLRIGAEDNCTYDYVFCPSEAEVYLLEDAKATCYNSEVALSWWIRTTGEMKNASGLYTSFVNMNGSVDKDGTYNYKLYGIRPAIWIDLNMCELVSLEK